MHTEPARLLRLLGGLLVFQRPIEVAAAWTLKGPLMISIESHLMWIGTHQWIVDYVDVVSGPDVLRIEVDTFIEA